MLSDSLRLVLERHLERVAPGDLAIWSLRGLSVLDPRIEATRRGAEIILRVEDRVLAAAPLAPLAGRDPPAAAAALSTLIGSFYEAGWRASPALRQAGAERLIASGFEEVFNHLDPYSRYLSPAEVRAVRERRVGQSALGLRIAVQGNALAVAFVTPQGPAAQAGIRAGDQLVAVEGRRLGPRDPGLAAALLEGPEGSMVRLSLLRAGRVREVILLREAQAVDTVTAERREEILWLRIGNFSPLTERQLTAALVDGFVERRPRGVVVDLRGNRGGLLSQAVAVADAFLAEGLVARTEGRHPDATRRYEAGGQDLARGLPVVVLVDGRTASAAEIVALALADRRRAAVVGSATMGKGLIQLVVPLPNEGEIMLTWSRVVAPSGWPLHGIGVLPALCTSLGPQALYAGLAGLAAGQAPMAATLARQRALRAPVAAADQVALRSACPAAEGRQADLLAARALIENPAAYAAALAASGP